MFLSKDPVAAREVLRNTPKDKLEKWAVLLNGIIVNDYLCLEMQCIMDDAPSFEEIRSEAAYSLQSIRTFLSIEATLTVVAR